MNKIALSPNDDRRIQSVDSIETYAYGTSKDLVCKKEESKCSNIIINFDYITKEDIKEHNPNWPQIPDYSHRIFIAGASGSGKTNALLNLISHQLDIDITYLYAKDLCKAKYQLLINKSKGTGIKHFNYSEAFIEYWNSMDNIYKNIEKHNPNKKRKILIVFDDMIADMLSKLNPIVT